jgi:hypothetical protein
MDKNPIRGKNLISFEVQKAINFSLDNCGDINNRGKSAKISPFVVSYEELENEIQRLINHTKSGKRFENYHSIFVYGPTGVGKCCHFDTIIKVKINGFAEKEVKIGQLVNILLDKDNLEGIKVETPSGFKKILKTIKTKLENKFYLELENSFYLYCADRHRVETENGWMFVKDLNYGNMVKTIDGFKKVKVIKDLQVKEEMYDIQVEDTKSYWSNGIHSHNSEIISQMAKNNGCKYHKIEIQKIPIEVFEGFPIIKQDEEGNDKLKLVPSNLLPPSEDDNVWLLHLDEFNKADTAKMAAVMNLVLTGEIGGVSDYNKKTGKSERYRLPEKTIIIGSGNFKTQDSVENMNMVNSMDIATSERFHRTILLDYNAESWMRSFALKEYIFVISNGTQKTYKLSTRIPGIILNFITDKMLDEGPKAPFLIPISVRPDEGGSERTTSPRTWTIIADNMILDGANEFENSKDKEKYEKLSEKIFGLKDKAFDVYMQNSNNQIELLSKQSPELGSEGEKLVHEIISKFIYYSSNRVGPQEVIFDYENKREKIKTIKDKTGAILNLVIGIANELCNVDARELTEKDIKKIAVRINTFFEDMKVPSEDLTAFIFIINKNGKENDFINNIERLLNGISERYKIANSDFYYTRKDEIVIE